MKRTSAMTISADEVPHRRDADHFKSRGGLGRLVNASRYSWQGLTYAWKQEAAFRQELIAALTVLPIALLAEVTPVERVLLIASVLLVLMIELLNSALEAVVDRIGKEHHPLSGHAKDLGSAAVMICLVLAASTWTIILL